MSSERDGISCPQGRTGVTDTGAINLFPVPCALLDSHGRVEAVNDAWRAGAGREPLLLGVGGSFLGVVGELTASRRAAAGVRDVVSGLATAFTFDIASGGAEGGRWFRLLAAGRPGGGGSVVMVDITDDPLHRESLLRNDERFREALESVHDYAIFTLDRDGRIVTWNLGAEHMTGHRSEEIVGQNISVLYAPEEIAAGKPDQALAAASSSGRFEDDGWRVRRDGARFWGNVVLTALRDGRGELRGYSQVVRDLTERRRSQMAVRDREARLMSIIESAMDAIITVDESQRVVMFNRAAEKIFGVPAADALGCSIERFIPDRFRAAHAGHVRSFGRTGVSTRSMGLLGAIMGLRADGAEFPLEASISQAVSGGQKFYTVILRDISERLKLEAKLLQAQKMEGIGRLAGGVAHDFNNMLMAIFNYLTLATRRLDSAHPAREAIAHAQEAADRAAALTRQLLAFARKQVVNPRPLSPRAVVSGLEKMLRRLIGEDVTLRTALDDDTWNVLADPSQLEQVIVNLAVNARDAMPRGGILTIETSNIVLDEAYCRTRIGASLGPHVAIAVTDTGEGMTPEIMSRLFEPFFTTKPQGKGTGLGLATCHGIVQQNGGHIAVYSEPGRGTSVKVFLPRIKDAAAEALTPAVAEPPPRGGSETILLAEDSDIVRDLAEAALKGAGYTVITAVDGRQAVEMAASHADVIDLLVTDVVMPEMNGVEMAKAVTKSRPGMPVIFMSGYTEETIAYHGVEPDRHVFMAKPFMTDVLLRRVREVLDAAKRT